MTRSRMHLLSALLLPALLLRALLPAGFMLEAHDEQLRIVLCSDGLEAPLDGGKGKGGPAPGDSGDCPFAHLPGSAPPPSLAERRLPAPPLLYLWPAGESIRPGSEGPPRATAARAPPFSCSAA